MKTIDCDIRKLIKSCVGDQSSSEPQTQDLNIGMEGTDNQIEAVEQLRVDIADEDTFIDVETISDLSPSCSWILTSSSYCVVSSKDKASSENYSSRLNVDKSRSQLESLRLVPENVSDSVDASDLVDGSDFVDASNPVDVSDSVSSYGANTSTDEHSGKARNVALWFTPNVSQNTCENLVPETTVYPLGKVCPRITRTPERSLRPGFSHASRCLKNVRQNLGPIFDLVEAANPEMKKEEFEKHILNQKPYLRNDRNYLSRVSYALLQKSWRQNCKGLVRGRSHE